MAVREFNGTTDQLICGIGAASGMTFGTAAAIIKLADVTDFRAIGHLHDSGGTFVANPVGTNTSPAWEMHNGVSSSNPALAAVSTGVWYLVVVRKATGSVAPRFSVYNYTAGTWAHAAGGTALANWTAPGVGGNVQFSFQANAGDVLNGRVAARAYWSNSLPWTADAAGDTAIQSSGLKDAAANWASNNPTAFWLFNQASTATSVVDLSTAGTAGQTSITGTTVVTTDDPAGFDFSLTATAAPPVGLQRWPAMGNWPRQQQQIFASPDPAPGTNAPADVATAAGTAFFDSSGGSISLNLIADSPITAAGTAYNATISTANATNAAAGLASGTGTAQNASITVAPTIGLASATGTAFTTTSKVSPGPTAATGTGAAQAPSSSVAPVSSVASGTGVANNASISTGSATNAAAGVATATGTANQSTLTVAPGATAATATGTAQTASSAVAPSPSTATGTGAAQGATGKISPSPAVATGTGTANNATVQTGSFTNAAAGVATGTGTAQQASGKTSTTPTTATATGTANAASAGSSVSAQAGLASATGTAYGPSVARGATANAGVATGTGTVSAAKLSVMATAEAAVALAAALNAAVNPTLKITPRPNTGRTIRPNTGVTPRP